MNIISAGQFSREEVEKLIDNAEQIRYQYVHYGPMACRFNQGRTLATLFYEPSTRTRLSFEAAMCRLGGNVITTENAAAFSSAIKGESLEDTIRIVSSYADVIVLRHPEKGSAERAAAVSKVPLINAGDGDGEHPTQALLDIYTVQRECGRVDGLHFAFVGDLRYGRTVHSLIRLLGLYENVKITLVSPGTLSLPQDVLKFIKEPVVTESLHEALAAKPDVVYLTRIQAERHPVMAAPLKEYTITRQEMGILHDKAILMHPLPRVSEIHQEVDSDPRAAYFRQAENGYWMRAGILTHLLGMD